MARFENRLPDETVNVGKTHPLVEIFWLYIGVFATVAVFVVALYLAGTLLARQVPFKWELQMADRLFASEHKEADAARSKALQGIADKLADGLVLPEGLRFRLLYADDAEVNAYATLGGIITIHRGLIEQMDSENELATIIGHEMGHIINRDPANATGGRLAVAAALLFVSPVIGVDGLTSLVGTLQNLTLMTFSRHDEARADETGLGLLARAYGHLGGAREMFEKLAAIESKYGLLMPPEVLSSHPDTKRRAALVAEEAKKLGVPESGPLKPLPAILKKKN